MEAKRKAQKQAPTVWLVSTGSYSEYRVAGIFSTEAEAERFRDWLIAKEGEYDVCIWQAPVDQWTLDTKRGTLRWSIYLQKTGPVTPEGFTWINHPFSTAAFLQDRWFKDDTGEAFALFCVVSARNRKQAVKVAEALREHYLKSELWGDDSALHIRKD